MTLCQKVVMATFLACVMASIGARVTAADLRTELSRRGLLLRTVVANFVVVPLVGILLTRWLVKVPENATAFVLLACTPGGISALQFTTKAGGATAYAGVTAGLLSVLAVVVSPLLIALALPTATPIAVPYLRVGGFLLAFLVLPMVVGMAMKARAERAAALLARALGLVSVVLYVTMVLVLMAARKEAIRQVGGRAVGLLLLWILFSMLVGWLLGGPQTATRQVLASATSMRHVALAIAITVHTFPDPTPVLAPLAAFSALMVPPNVVLTVVCLIANRRRARKAASRTTGPAAGTAPG